jgi:hypothetical protein
MTRRDDERKILKLAIIAAVLLIVMFMIGSAKAQTVVTGAGPSTSSQVITLFSGCSGVQYLGADGACHTIVGFSPPVTATQSANGANLEKFKRFTDVAPTGFFDFFRDNADTTTLFSVDVSGNLVATTVATSGSTAGVIDYAQGSTNAAAAPCTTATSICEQAPTAVTSYLVTKPGAPAQGSITGTLSGTTITQGFSGDTNHSTTVTIGSGTSIGSTSLCSTTFCPVGTYRVNTYLDITTPCGTSGSYTVNLIYTDDQGSKTVPININGTGAVASTGVLTTTSTANFGEDTQILRSTGAASINYSTTAVACGTAGPMVGKLYLSVEAVQ